jgi:hypothetical protein
MSTKIFHGFKFKNPDILTIRRQLLAFQDRVAELAREFTCKMIAAMIFDLRKKPPKDPLFFAAGSEIEKRMRQADESQVRNGFDLKFEIAVIPLRKNLTLGMFFTEQRGWVQELQKQKWFVDYAYWDNTDKPDDVDNREWRKRKRDWDEAVGYDTASRRGFIIGMHKPYWQMATFNTDPDMVLWLVRKGWKECTLKDLLGKDWRKVAENLKRMSGAERE